ncbi:MAG: type II toxin-antitoxin system RelE/ParE family toxin [Thermoleophilia bacterium]|nr:type II toxin-antitoxin system RelE/ParE family toxin [Thermoleophilia bacterium]
MSTRYTVRLAGPVVRAIQQDLPEAVAGATIEFFNGALRENPHRVGPALRNDLEGLWSARRGSFRVIYAIDDSAAIVSVVRVDHRRDVYR